MIRKVINTDDGSTTIYLPEMDEHYHSTHGAIQEARHVFIESGLNVIDKKDIHVFEMGFGTGLNAILSYEFAQKLNKKIIFHGIEAYPVEHELVQSLNYKDLLESNLHEVFDKMHSIEWNRDERITDSFTLMKIHSKIEDYDLLAEKYDIIFFDAFGPRAQKAMWTNEILSKMEAGLQKGGILVTYCAQGQFKRNLKELGFRTERLPGPPGKREMTRAWKDELHFNKT